MKISLGHVPFPWEWERLVKFYEEIAKSPISEVYIGEVVCHKREILNIDRLSAIAKMLEESGKKVIISTLALITNQEEIEYTEELFKLPFAIEANNIAILNMADGKEMIAGLTLNVYNSPSLKFLREIGIKRIVFPCELSIEAIFSLIDGLGGETEIFGFGNLPLSFSWRCYIARAFNFSRKDCSHVCMKFSQGMSLETLDKNPLFTINGTQILSTKNYCLIGEIDLLREMGITSIRISPQEENTREIIEVFKQRIDGVLNTREAIKELRNISKTEFCNGWFYGKAGWFYMDPEIVTLQTT